MDVKTRLVKLRPYIVSFVLLILALVFYIVTNSVLSKQAIQIKSLNDQIHEAQRKSAMVDSQIRKATEDAKSSASGLDFSRVNSDYNLAEKFLKECLTWSNESEYRLVRENILYKYGTDVTGGEFMNLFMPEIPVIKDADGNVYEEFGEIANLEYVSMDQHVVDVSSSGDYSYFSEVVIASTDASGHRGQGRCVVLYTTDRDGNLHNIDAYTVAGFVG